VVNNVFSVKKIISRADEITIQDILGEQLIKLVQLLDTSYQKTGNLKSLIFQIYQERSFLDNRDLRITLIDLLKFEEVKLIADTLGYLSSNDPDEYTFLKRKKFVFGSEDEIIFYNFFNNNIPKSTHEVSTNFSSIENVLSDYQFVPAPKKSSK
jgi:DNA repair protein RadD